MSHTICVCCKHHKPKPSMTMTVFVCVDECAADTSHINFVTGIPILRLCASKNMGACPDFMSNGNDTFLPESGQK